MREGKGKEKGTFYFFVCVYRAHTLELHHGGGWHALVFLGMSCAFYYLPCWPFSPARTTTTEIQQTKQVYEQNQIPVILLTQQNLINPSWQKNLYEKLEQTSRQPLNYMSVQKYQ